MKSPRHFFLSNFCRKQRCRVPKAQMSNKYGIKKVSPEICTENLELQILDIDITDTIPPAIEYVESDMISPQFRSKIPPRTNTKGTVCTVLLYTVNEYGENFLVKVNRFKPYLIYEYKTIQAQKSIIENMVFGVVAV